MKKHKLLLLLLLTLFSCQEDTLDPVDALCAYKPEVFAPEGYQIETIGTLESDKAVLSNYSFNFLSEELGFALASNEAGGYVEILKTEDGGKTWKDLEIGFDQFAGSMVFLDAQLGFIPANEFTNCSAQTGCTSRGTLLKTEDGGDNWEEINFPGPNAQFSQMKVDDEGTLFADLKIYDSQGFQAYLMKSVDKGVSWDTVSIPSVFPWSTERFSFKPIGDHIYLYSRDGDIGMIDKAGNLIKIIKTNKEGLFDFRVLDENNMVAENWITGEVLKSTDAGETWELLSEKRTRLIDVNLENEWLAILNKSRCPASFDYYKSNDLIASSKDGGLSWVEAEEVTTNMESLFIGLVGSQQVAKGEYLILIGNKLMRLSEN